MEIHSTDEYYDLPQSQFSVLHGFLKFYLCRMLTDADILGGGGYQVCVTDLNTVVFGIMFSSDHIFRCAFYPHSLEINVKNKLDGKEELFNVHIPSVPEFFWDVIHKKLPEWNENVYQLCDYIIGFYCDGEKNQKVHNHQICFDIDDIDCPTITLDSGAIYGSFGVPMFIRAIEFGKKIKNY